VVFCTCGIVVIAGNLVYEKLGASSEASTGLKLLATMKIFTLIEVISGSSGALSLTSIAATHTLSVVSSATWISRMISAELARVACCPGIVQLNLTRLVVRLMLSESIGYPTSRLFDEPEYTVKLSFRLSIFGGVFLTANFGEVTCNRMSS